MVRPRREVPPPHEGPAPLATICQAAFDKVYGQHRRGGQADPQPTDPTVVIIRGMRENGFSGYTDWERVQSLFNMLLPSETDISGWVQDIDTRSKGVYKVKCGTAAHVLAICGAAPKLRYAGPEMARVYVSPDRPRDVRRKESYRKNKTG